MRNLTLIHIIIIYYFDLCELKNNNKEKKY